MGVFYRLRRSVALFICPEMGVEARPGLASAIENDLWDRILSAPDPWAEALRWLKHGRCEGFQLGDDAVAIIGKVILMAAALSGPMRRGGK